MKKAKNKQLLVIGIILLLIISVVAIKIATSDQINIKNAKSNANITEQTQNTPSKIQQLDTKVTEQVEKIPEGQRSQGYKIIF